MKVIPFIISNEPLFSKFGECGEYNGYVAVSPDNWFYGKPALDEDMSCLAVHGGITFAEFVTMKETTVNGWKVSAAYIGKRHPLLTANEPIFLGDTKEIPDDWFIIGFDTCHFGDNKESWNKLTAANETLALAEQLERRERNNE